MFCEVLHIRPWEIGDLPLDKFDQAISYFDQLNEQAAESGT
jgi:hypothetical protein